MKSVKQIIVKTIGQQVLSFEEFYTILVQIEACVNSRPLCQISDNPNDFEVLTPGHFLIGAALLAPPCQNEISSNTSVRRLWNLVSQITKHFWNRWNVKYIHTLQYRPKWQNAKQNLKVGDLVLLKESNEIMSWVRARVIEIHPGKDGMDHCGTT